MLKVICNVARVLLTYRHHLLRNAAHYPRDPRSPLGVTDSEIAQATGYSRLGNTVADPQLMRDFAHQAYQTVVGGGSGRSMLAHDPRGAGAARSPSSQKMSLALIESVRTFVRTRYQMVKGKGSREQAFRVVGYTTDSRGRRVSKREYEQRLNR